MLDHMSGGRLEVGVGRGVSPFELNFHNVDHDESRDIFIDAYECLKTALSGEQFSHAGKYFNYTDVPMPMSPLQTPYPAFWYGSSNTIGAAWAGDHGMHFVANGQTDLARENIGAFRDALAKRGAPAHPKDEFPGGTAIGLLRHIVVTDTDEEARRIAKPALEHHAGSLNWLRKRHGSSEFTNRLGVHRGETFESWQELEMVIAGSPETVAAEIERQAGLLGINYLLTYLFFGTMTLADALRSLELFRTEVMPKLAGL